MIYFICSRVNRDSGSRVVDFLRGKGINVYFPIMETPQHPLSLMFKTNITKIINSELIIAFAKDEISRNWAFEAGFALGLGKAVICLIGKDTDLEQHDMVHQKLIKVYSMEELGEELDKIIDV